MVRDDPPELARAKLLLRDMSYATSLGDMEMLKRAVDKLRHLKENGISEKNVPEIPLVTKYSDLSCEAKEQIRPELAKARESDRLMPLLRKPSPSRFVQ